VNIFIGKGLENPYLQKMLNGEESHKDTTKDKDGEQETTETKDEDCEQETTETKDKDGEQETTESPKDLNDLIKPSIRKSRMFQSPYVKPLKKSRIVSKSFPLCASLMKDSTDITAKKNDHEDTAENNSDKAVEVTDLVSSTLESQQLDLSPTGCSFSLTTVIGGKPELENMEPLSSKKPYEDMEHHEDIKHIENVEPEPNQDVNGESVIDGVSSSGLQVEKDEDVIAQEDNLGNGNIQDTEMEMENDNNVTQDGNDVETEDSGAQARTKWQCNNCGKSYLQLKSFRVHKCDKGIPPKVPCPSCSKLISRSNISHHLKIHTTGKKLKCNKCQLDFESEELKKAHMKTHAKHLCSVCGKTFKRPCLLKEHTKAHESEKESCEVMGDGPVQKDKGK
jgi:hypothetical protein